ncbi:MAG: ComF family protein [Candidatus Kerfeldbacteria bacterium]|nr:ComF family protein [Candidatus Kerfeldbacteria bacterium]
MYSNLTHLLRRSLDLLFPTICLGCACRGPLLCPACWQTLAIPRPFRCIVCGREEPWGRTCVSCTREAGGIDGAWVVGEYAAPLLRQAIGVFKYESVPALAQPLAGLLFSILEREAVRRARARFGQTILVPVPMDRGRQRRRGFNHAALLAATVSLLVDLPVADALEKQSRPAQTLLAPDERLINLRGAISVRQQLAVFAKTVILVDDVVTTGATARACATALRTAGARRVWLLTLARG